MSYTYSVRPAALFQFLLAATAVGLAYAFAVSANYIHAIQYVGGSDATFERGLPPQLFGLGSVASEFIAPVALISALAAFRKATLKGFVIGIICLGVMVPALAWNARSIVGATATSIDRFIAQQEKSAETIAHVRKQLDSVRAELHSEQDRLTFLSTQTFRRRYDRRVHAGRVDATRERIAALRAEEQKVLRKLAGFEAVSTNVDAGSAAILRVLKDAEIVPSNVTASAGAQYSALLLAGFLLLTTLFGPILLGETMERIVVRRRKPVAEAAPGPAVAEANHRVIDATPAKPLPLKTATAKSDVPAMPPAPPISAETATGNPDDHDVPPPPATAPVPKAPPAPVMAGSGAQATGSDHGGATQSMAADADVHAQASVSAEASPSPQTAATQTATVEDETAEADLVSLEETMAALIAAFPPKHPETISVRGQRFARIVHKEFGPGTSVSMDDIKDRWAEFHKQSRLPLGPHGDLVFSLIRAGFVCESDPSDPSRKICHVPEAVTEFGKLRVVA